MDKQEDFEIPPVDVAFAEFEKAVPEFKTYFDQDLSETDTRSKVIDQILHILGWPEVQIERECHERTEGQFLDYKLKTTHPIFVIEAKKNFVRFELPQGKRRFFRVGGAIKNSKNLRDAIEQCRRYASNSGVVFCCVTNGFQFVFFRATNSFGVAWEDQLVAIFRDHADVLSRFIEFYDLLSHEGVSTGRANECMPVQELAGHTSSRFKCLRDGLSIRNETRDRNVLFPYTRQLIRYVFQSLDNEEAPPELLEHCYVESSRDSSYERGIGELLKEHKTKIPNVAGKIQTQKRHAGTFQAHFESLAGQRLSYGAVTLILGTLGAGKTSFLNRFRKVFAKDLIDSSFIWIQVSFDDFTETSDDLSEWVVSRVAHILDSMYSEFKLHAWETLNDLYHREITVLREGLLKPYFSHNHAEYEAKLSEKVTSFVERREAHMHRCLAYVAGKTRRQIVFVFDNADQHSPALQNDVFLLAQKYSQQLKCVAFISLREESYWKNKEFGGLSAFHPTAFQISAPRIEQVVAKRFRYASKLILDDQLISVSGFSGLNLDLTPRLIDHIIKVIQGSILSDDKLCSRFLEYMAPGEVRRALDFVARFITSGHTNINRIIDDARSGRVLLIGFHEFLQAVMLVDRSHYEEAYSDVVNLFAADGKSDQSHFNRLAVLARVLGASGDTSESGKGYVSVAEVVNDCEALGVNPETTSSIIGFLTQKRLLATETLERDVNVAAHSIRATTAALYYVTELGQNFTYIDLVMMDTEIGNDQDREELLKLSREVLAEGNRLLKLEKRIERARRFLRYIQNEFEQSTFIKASGKFSSPALNFIPRLVSGFEAQAKVVLENAAVAFSK